jgi:putative inorganic carbon (hco3(-)) transporter
MSERLTFNLGGRSRRELRDRVDWVTAPIGGDLPAAAARFLPPIERPNWGFWGVFLFTALLFFRPQDTFPPLAPLHLPEVAAICALIAMIGHRMGRNLPIVRWSPEIIGVSAMAAVMLATVPFSVWPGGALSTFTDVYFKVVIVFILMINSIRAVRTLRWFSWLILCAMGYVAARGVLDYLSGVNLIKGERLHGSISGLMGNPNDLAMNMVTFLPLAAMIAIARGKPLPRAIAALIAVLMAATVLFTKSRAGLLGLGTMAVFLILEGRRLRPGLGVAAIVACLAATPFMPNWFWTRLSSITNAEDDESGSRQARVDLMKEGWQAFVDHPLTGVGAGQFKNYDPDDRVQPWHETHNVLLQVAAELGLFGLLAFVYLLWGALSALLWTRRIFGGSLTRARPPDSSDGTVPVTDAFRTEEREWMQIHTAAMTAGFAGWFVCAQFASVGYYWTFYYLFALIVAGRELTRDRFEAAHRATSGPAGPAWKERLIA